MIRPALLAVALLAPSLALAGSKDDPYGDSSAEEEPASTRLALAPDEGSNLIQLLQPIKFTTASTEIAMISKLVLLDVAAVIEEHPEWTKIDIGGHTDSVGAADKNHVLSQGRAEAVLEALVKGGVTRARLTATGYGESKPVVEATDESGHSRNRRVEFKVVE
jgi:outer membrane protein OmpA-like peptidoglycan-associated protein